MDIIFDTYALQDYVATRWYRAPELCGSFFSKVSPIVISYKCSLY
jgi:mitogen-activated protein kinase 1/3